MAISVVMLMVVVVFQLQMMVKLIRSFLLCQSGLLLQGLLQVLNFLLGLLQLKIKPNDFAILILFASQLRWLLISLLELKNEFITLDL